MGVNLKTALSVKSFSTGMLCGWLAAMTWTVVLSAAAAVMVELGKLSLESMGYGVMIMLLLCAYVGATTAIKYTEHKKMVASLLCGALYYTSMTVLLLMLFGMKYDAIGISAMLVAAGSLASALVHSDEKRGKAGKKRKHRL